MGTCSKNRADAAVISVVPVLFWLFRRSMNRVLTRDLRHPCDKTGIYGNHDEDR